MFSILPATGIRKIFACLSALPGFSENVAVVCPGKKMPVSLQRERKLDSKVFHPTVPESTKKLLLVEKSKEKVRRNHKKAKASNTDLVSDRKWLCESKEICYILLV